MIIYLWRAAEWQDSIRAVMKMAPVETAHPLKVCAVALITFVVLLALGRLFVLVSRFLAACTMRVIPRKAANVIGVAIAVLLFWSIASNVLIRTAFNALDSSFRELDVLLEPERPQPADPDRTGGAASLVKWRELGRMGRRFIASGPRAAEISAVTAQAAQDPVRVYVGLGGAETIRRWALANVYAPEHYVDAWVAVTDVHDWSADALARLKNHLAARARQAAAGSAGEDPYADRGG